MTLGILAFALGILWIIGFFVFHLGAWVHLLLLAAVILTMMRMAKKPVN